MSRDWHWGLALLGACLLFFWPVAAGQSFYFRDTIDFYHPQALLTMQAYRAGELPLWEPTLSLGYPFQADPHSLVFYPPAIFLALLPWPRGYDLFTALHVPLLGLGTFWLLRRWELGRPSAAVGAAVSMFCGFTVSCLSLTTLLRGLAWTPSVLAAFEGFLSTRRASWLAATALLLALEGSGTDPNYALYTGVLLVATALLSPGARPGRLMRNLAGAIAAGLLAVSVLAVVYLPLLELIANSSRKTGLGNEELEQYPVHPVNLYNTLLPAPFPEATSELFSTSFHNAAVPFYPELYWGLPLLCLAIAALAWFGTPLGRPTGFALGLVVAGLVLSVGTHLPFFRLLMKLAPPLRYFRFPAKYFFFAAVGMALLAGLGFEAISRRRDARVAHAVFAAIFALACVGCLIGIGVSGDYWPRPFLFEGGRHVTGDVQRLLATVRAPWIANLSWAAITLGLLFALTVFSPRSARGATAALAAIGLITCLDVGLGTRRSLQVAGDLRSITDSPTTEPLVRFTRSTHPPARIVQYPRNTGDALAGAAFIEHLRLSGMLQMGLRGCTEGLASLMAMPSVWTGGQYRLFWAIYEASGREERDRLAGALGASVALSAEGLGNTPGTGKVLLRAGPVIGREIPNPAPRAFIAERVARAAAGVSLPTTASILALPREAVVEADALPGEDPGKLAPARRRCAIARYERHAVDVDFEVDSPGLLVVLDEDYPGWEAAVDGQPRPIVRVSGLVRGVIVRPGERKLEMRYRPRAFRTGAIVSAVSLLLLVVLGATSRRREA